MVMQQRHPRARLVVAEARGHQTAGRPHPIDAVLAVPDHRDLVLDPLQHPYDRPLVRGLDHPSGLLIPQRPQEVDRRLRPEHEVDTGDRHPASESAGLERLLRGGALGEQFGLDPVRVRVSAPLAEEAPQLRLGDFLSRRESEHCQAAAHPSPGRNTGPLLSLAQRRAGQAPAVTDDGLAQEVAVHLTGSDDPDIHCHGDHATRLWPTRKGRSARRPAGREQRPNFLLRCPSAGKRRRAERECHRSPSALTPRPGQHHPAPLSSIQHHGTNTAYSSPRGLRRTARGRPVPTFETLPRFTTDLQHLAPAQRRRFRRVVLEAFVPDLPTGRQFRPGLREAREFAESWMPCALNRNVVAALGGIGVRVRWCAGLMLAVVVGQVSTKPGPCPSYRPALALPTAAPVRHLPQLRCAESTTGARRSQW